MDFEDDSELPCQSHDFSEDFYTKLDDDLDCFFALYLQSEDGEHTAITNSSAIHKLTTPDVRSIKQVVHMKNENEEPLDYQYALNLQSQLLEENNSIPVGTGVKWNTCSNEHGSRRKNNETMDYECALHLQSQLLEEKKIVQKHGNGKSNEFTKLPSSIVDIEWESLDPNPDIHSLFLQFNKEYFWETLGEVEVRWSHRMTLCAGVCSYEGRGGLCSIRLSQPLLKYRPRRDLVETLLHEMIHAYLFVTHYNKDHDSHGPEFLKHMNRINQQSGTKISVYHNFHDEVDVHRKHWWKCNGPCQNWAPFFGIVKRAMNRTPSSQDFWWNDHQAKCGGTFHKIKEPEGYGQKKNHKRKIESTTGAKEKLVAQDIRRFFSESSSTDSHLKESKHGTWSAKLPQPSNVYVLSSPKRERSDFVLFSGQGFMLGSSEPKPKNFQWDQNNGLKIKNKFETSANFSSNSSTLFNKREKMLHRNNINTNNMPNESKTKTVVSSKNHHGNSRALGSLNNTAVKPSSTCTKTSVVKNPGKDLEKVTKTSKPQNLQFLGKGYVLGKPSSDTKNTSSSNSVSSILTKRDQCSKSSVADFFLKSVKDRMFSNLNEQERNFSNTLQLKVGCPVCGSMVGSSDINAHLDMCLQPS